MTRAEVNRQWTSAVLGADGRQRTRVKQVLVSTLMYAGISAVLWLGVWMGAVEPRAAAAVMVPVLFMSAVFYIAIRSGYNLRFSSDQGLVGIQGVFCVLASVGAYVAAGPIRGAMLMTLVLGQFFAAFALQPAHSRRISYLAAAALGITMAVGAYVEPSTFEPRQELLHFLMLALMLPGISWLAGRLSDIRTTLAHQSAQLDAALKQNRLLATQDELTGLSNRRDMTSLMTSERGRQQRHRSPISIVLLDIDHFKRINDELGHQAGDLVLQIFADVISHGLRTGDSLARWGGEEFLLMLPNTAADDARVCVDRMRIQLAGRSFAHIAPKLTVTFSAGIGVCQVDDRTDAVVERADRAMHEAKTTGRNRTVVA